MTPIQLPSLKHRQSVEGPIYYLASLDRDIIDAIEKLRCLKDGKWEHRRSDRTLHVSLLTLPPRVFIRVDACCDCPEMHRQVYELDLQEVCDFPHTNEKCLNCDHVQL